MMDKKAGEIAERLQEYGPEFVDEKGNPGPLRKHLARIEIISRQVDQLARLTGKPEDRIRTVNCLATAERVPMQFHDAWLGRVDVVSDLDAFVAGAPDARFGTDGKRRPGAATKARGSAQTAGMAESWTEAWRFAIFTLRRDRLDVPSEPSARVRWHMPISRCWGSGIWSGVPEPIGGAG